MERNCRHIFELSFHDLLTRTEENSESRYLATGPRIEPGTSRLRCRCGNRYIETVVSSRLLQQWHSRYLLLSRILHFASSLKLLVWHEDVSMWGWSKTPRILNVDAGIRSMCFILCLFSSAISWKGDRRNPRTQMNILRKGEVADISGKNMEA